MKGAKCKCGDLASGFDILIVEEPADNKIELTLVCTGCDREIVAFIPLGRDGFPIAKNWENSASGVVDNPIQAGIDRTVSGAIGQP